MRNLPKILVIGLYASMCCLFVAEATIEINRYFEDGVGEAIIPGDTTQQVHGIGVLVAASTSLNSTLVYSRSIGITSAVYLESNPLVVIGSECAWHEIADDVLWLIYDKIGQVREAVLISGDAMSIF